MLSDIKRTLLSYRFSVAVRPHRANLVRMMERRVGQMADAEDIVQTALEKASRAVLGPNAEPMPPPAAFPFWLRLVTFNAMKDYFRALPAANDASFDPEVHSLENGLAPSPLEELEAEERAAQLAASIRRLPDELRHVLVMREIELMTQSEVAAALGISEGNVRIRAHRARAAVLAEMRE